MSVKEKIILFDYQEEIINCKESKIIINACRGAGKTLILSKILERRKPIRVLYVGTKQRYIYFIDNILNNTSLESDVENYSGDQDLRIKGVYTFKYKLYEQFYNYVNIIFYAPNIANDIVEDYNYDYIFFEDVLPYELEKKGIKGDKIISTITMNNVNKEIQAKYPEYKVFDIDYTQVVKNNLLDCKHINKIKEMNMDLFYKEYAIKEDVKEMNEYEFYNTEIKKLMEEYTSMGNSEKTTMTRERILGMIKEMDKLRMDCYNRKHGNFNNKPYIPYVVPYNQNPIVEYLNNPMTCSSDSNTREYKPIY